MAYTTIKQKPCKCGCGLMPTIGCRGYVFDHLPKLEKIEKINKHRIAKNKAQQRANTTRLLHLAQRGVGKPKSGLKRQNKPIAKASAKRILELKKYVPLKKKFIKEHPICECGLPDCNKGKSVDIHHPYMGRDRAKYFLEVDTWKAVSRKDHIRIHNEFSTEQLVELGLRKFELPNAKNGLVLF